MEAPTIRPGAINLDRVEPDLFAYFHNAAGANAAIQLLTALGVPDEQLAVTPPEEIDGGQGILLAMVCPDGLRTRIEGVCRSYGAEVHRVPQ